MATESPKHFDPVLWVERLIEVNEESMFNLADKTQINNAFVDLKKALEKNRD